MRSKLDLERQNIRLRGDLLTIAVRVSHDLRTPLSGIVSAGEMLKDMLAQKEPDAVAMTDALFASVDDMTRLINQLRFVAKASATPQPKTQVNMGGIVLEATQSLERRIIQKGATVDASGSWPDVEGVAEWLVFVWRSLLANALQHGGGKIQLGWSRLEHEFQFWILDDGRGVPASERAKLFQPFDSLHEMDSTRGLGLSIVRRLVDLQEGRCGYDSIDAGGLAFYFTLPAANDVPEKIS